MLSVHGPGEQTVCFKNGEEEEMLMRIRQDKDMSALQAFMTFSKENPRASEMTFTQVSFLR